ncbi:MAG: hypothetical protein PHZ11_09360 [Desulfitobacteriaceae bacterium]|nr:hypothetical protein [Desulfitobacteriaceae bacterium]MDD4347071.1 hypothetical protein [Desulfitobacteriaceae bacterium]MDD4401990.1 hypothetical protein [Desulfitobacteriaceae bacterium]
MNRVKKQLLYLAIWEFAALFTFVFLYISLNLALNLGMASFIAFSYLILILLQGSIYWFYRYLLIMKKERFGLKAINFIRFLRWLNIIILVVISGLIPFVKSSNKDLIIAIAVFLFGIIEYINYYWYRLSYGRSGFNIRILLNTRLQKSSIGKLINK